MRLNNKYLILALALLLGGSKLAAQQLPVITQYIYHPYLYNPARAGHGEFGNVSMSFKKQWDNMPYSPITSLLSFDMPVKSTNMGIGAIVYSDRAHLQRTSGGMISYAYHIPFNTQKTHRLSVGINAGILHQKFDFQDAEVIDINDPTIFDEANGAARFDMAAGINYQFKGLNVGFAVPQLVRGQFNFRDNTIAENVTIQLERHYYTFASYRHGFGKTKDIYLEPVFAMRKVTAIPMQFDMNLIFDYKNVVWLSGGYRTANKFTEDAGVNFAAGFGIKQRVNTTYTFETLVGKDDRAAFGNSHEVLISLSLGRDKKEIENKLKDVETNVIKNTDDIAQIKEEVEVLKEDVASNQDELDSLSEKIGGQAEELKEIQELIKQNTQSIQQIKQIEEQNMIFKKMGSVYFNLDSYQLSDQAKSSIIALKDAVKDYQGDMIFYVAGSASIEGTAQYNLILALRRAAAVKSYMKEMGIKGEVLLMTYGAESQDFSDKPNNRRADIYVTGQK
jgi:type IX secretion system PorP/SprF family membrane protein